ncbi:MAG TPA: RNA polymerase sigma factor [Steroidobacteraceae bacterium]|nr:RNA polymerase sigma factor [Steroidobacteraceae bacterium]
MSRFLAISPEPACLRLAAAGDRAAQHRVYELTAAPVFALVRRLVRSRAAAEDVFQDCMIALLDHLGDYRGDAPFGAWVRQVAARHCLMHLRSPWQRARRALWPDGSDAGLPAPHDAALRATAAAVPEAALAEHIDLERALSQLPGTDRAVVWLHDVEGLTHEEIAALFRRTTSFSKSRLARAHALLRAALDDHRPADRQLPAAGLAAQGQVP